MQQHNLIFRNHQTLARTNRSRLHYSQLTAFLLCLLLVISFSACGRMGSDDQAAADSVSDQREPDEDNSSEEGTESDESEEESSDDAETSGDDDSDDSDTSGLGPIIAWPESTPDSVPELKNANITAVVPAQGSLTMMFETADTELIKAYVDTLGKEGFEQTSLSENKFGLDYYGSNGGVSVFINYISGGLSKLAIEF